jgi:HAD superfamily hydrolase (TIGR01490 family)
LRAGAIFDLDGTLIQGTSAERLFLPYLQRRGLLGPRQWLAFLASACLLPITGWTAAFRRNKHYLTGLEVQQIQQVLPDFLNTVLEKRFCAPVVERLERLREDGIAVYLLTGAPDFLALAIGERFGATEAVGTRLEVRDGRFTGRLSGPHYFGQKKVEGVMELAERYQLDLRQSYGFADHVHDIPFLERFGHPVAVEPKLGLLRHARRCGWEIIHCG